MSMLALQKAFQAKIATGPKLILDNTAALNMDYINELDSDVESEFAVTLADMAEYSGFKYEEILAVMNTIELPKEWELKRTKYFEMWLIIIAKKGFKCGRKVATKSDKDFVTFYTAFNKNTKGNIVKDNTEGSKLTKSDLTPARIALVLLPKFMVVCSRYFEPVVRSSSNFKFYLHSPIFAGLIPNDVKYDTIFAEFVKQVCLPFAAKVPKSYDADKKPVYATEDETTKFANLGRSSVWIKEETRLAVMKGAYKTGAKYDMAADIAVAKLAAQGAVAKAATIAL